MVEFDASRSWVILSTGGGPAGTAASCLARGIASLRERTKTPGGLPAVLDAERAEVGDATPLIVLNRDTDSGQTGESSQTDGFAWRAGESRIELHGDTDRGLLYASLDFLEALGIRRLFPGADGVSWPRSGPASSGERGAAAARFTLARSAAHLRPRFARRGLAMAPLMEGREALEWIEWAGWNRLDTLLLELAPGVSRTRNLDTLVRAARRFGMEVEVGGRLLSPLLPRSDFLLHPDRFRMASGRRRADGNFCPTNPETIERVRSRAAEFFRAWPEVSVFHLWPEKGYSPFPSPWCSCPSCRAFSPLEQETIATNAVADVLEAERPGARLSFLSSPEFQASSVVKPRPAVFPLIEEPSVSPSFVTPSAPEGTRALVRFLDYAACDSVLPPLGDGIARELELLEKAGIASVYCRVSAGRLPGLPTANGWAFARLCWDRLDPALDSWTKERAARAAPLLPEGRREAGAAGLRLSLDLRSRAFAMAAARDFPAARALQEEAARAAFDALRGLGRTDGEAFCFEVDLERRYLAFAEARAAYRAAVRAADGTAGGRREAARAAAAVRAAWKRWSSWRGAQDGRSRLPRATRRKARASIRKSGPSD